MKEPENAPASALSPFPSADRQGMLPRRGLHRRLLASFLLLSLLPLFGANAVGYFRSRRIVEGQVEQYVHGIADLQATHVAEHIKLQLAYLGAIGAGNRFLQAAAERDLPDADPAMRSVADEQAVTAYLQRQIDEAEGRFTDMALFSTAGAPLASAGGRRLHNKGGPAFDPVTVIRESGTETPPTLEFTVPVTSPEGQVVAYLSGSISTATAQITMEIAAHVGGNIESFILEPSGRPVFISHDHGVISYNEPLANPLLERPPGSTDHYVNPEGIEVIGTTASMPDSPWLFLAEIPAEAALGDLRSLQRLFLALGSVFALLVLGTGWFLASGIVAPVRQLVAATRRVAAGELEARVGSESRDEIGELAGAFNDMAAELAESEKRIRALHAREIERAEQLATVGELAAGLAHEIKNPVVGIANGMDLLLRRVGTDRKLIDIGHEMTRQLERIQHAVQDLLDFARPRLPERSPADINDLIRGAATLVEHIAVKAGVALRLDLDRTVPSFSLDGEQIRQAVVNLAVNAVQHSERGDVVRISTRAVPGYVEIAVADTGKGIEDSLREQLFKPFFTTRHSGTGLGLAITRGIVERHEGTINVRSTVGEGSTFTIVLPVSPEIRKTQEDPGEL